MTDTLADTTPDRTKLPRHFVDYILYKVRPEWRLLPQEQRDADKDELTAVIESWADRIMVRTFSTVGVRADADLLIWRSTTEFEHLQQMQTDILSTNLGCYLDVTYSFTATTKQSQYLKDVRSAGVRKERPMDVIPIDSKYLIMYPMDKVRPWYGRTQEERGASMREHAMVGRNYPSIKLNTAYSFGIDDQEFVVAFETDSIHDFLDLMMELRHTDASQYTLRDTPIFTCISMSVRESLDALGGVTKRVTAGV